MGIRRLVIGTVCWIILVPWIAAAQPPSTVGDVLDRGGKRVGRDDLVALVSGATISGSQVGRPQTTFENIHRPDGTASGRALDRSVQFGGQLTYDGTWSVDERDQVCVEFRNNRGNTFKSCTVWYVLDGTYYSAGTDDRRAEVYRRDLRR
jgi:hypothetical protein